MLTKEERSAIAERSVSFNGNSLCYTDIYRCLFGEDVPSNTRIKEDDRNILDRLIDLCDTSHMIELPLDKNGEVIRVGDVVYDEDGDKYEVMGYEVDDSETNIILDNEPGSVSISAAPNELTHKQPVTAKSLAQRIREVLDGICNTGYAVEELSDIAMQLERLGDNDE